MPADRSLYLPILVGSVFNYVPGIEYQRDDEGENISKKNPNYNELTAIYWAWKNLKNVDAIGLVHYRRYFSIHGKRRLDNVISKRDANRLLSNYDVVLPKKRHYYIESNYSHYIHAHKTKPLDLTRQVIEKKYPKYLNYFDLVMSQRGAHMFNMFIMKSDLFEEYAAWIFDVLGNVENELDISEYSKQESRVYGYLAELLMDVWIYKNKVNYCEIGWEQLGRRHLFSKTFQFLNRKFHLKKVKKTHF